MNASFSTQDLTIFCLQVRKRLALMKGILNWVPPQDYGGSSDNDRSDQAGSGPPSTAGSTRSVGGAGSAGDSLQGGLGLILWMLGRGAMHGDWDGELVRIHAKVPMGLASLNTSSMSAEGLTFMHIAAIQVRRQPILPAFLPDSTLKMPERGGGVQAALGIYEVLCTLIHRTEHIPHPCCGAPCFNSHPGTCLPLPLAHSPL